MRGGHQLVMDGDDGKMYLFGGWDGCQDLNDLWCYDVKKSHWLLLHKNSAIHGGPDPRSCHKMVLNSKKSTIYLLGRFLDLKSRQNKDLIYVN